METKPPQGLNIYELSDDFKLLRKAGMVRPQRLATHIYYCLPNQDLMKIVEKMVEWMKTRENYDSV